MRPTRASGRGPRESPINWGPMPDEVGYLVEGRWVSASDVTPVEWARANTPKVDIFIGHGSETSILLDSSPF